VTPEHVKERFEEIRKLSGDPEMAHSREDDLYLDILTAIRDGTIIDAVRCCEEALKTHDLSFPRWCA